MQEPPIQDLDQAALFSSHPVKVDYKWYLVRIACMIVFNILMFGLIIKGPRSIAENFYVAVNANLVGNNIIGFILGIFLALFPYKNLSYKKKYLRASLLSILILQITAGVLIVLLGIMTLLGWY